MPEVQIYFTKVQMSKIEELAAVAEPNVSLFLKSHIIESLGLPTYDIWDIIEERVERLPSGEDFTLPELLKDRWDTYDDSYRRTLGGAFSKGVNDGQWPGVEDLERLRNGAEVYKKI